jgi:hypothetical protein
LKATHSSGVSPKHRYRLWHCLVPRLGDGDQIRAVPSAAKMPESRTRFRFMELAWENIHCIWNSPSRCSSRCSRSSAYSSRSLSSPTMRSGSCSARTSCLPAENSAVDSADASLGRLPGIDRHEPSWSLRLLPFQCRSRHLTSIFADRHWIKRLVAIGGAAKTEKSYATSLVPHIPNQARVAERIPRQFWQGLRGIALQSQPGTACRRRLFLYCPANWYKRTDNLKIHWACPCKDSMKSTI